ncbi:MULTISPECIES: DapH/DapD/GlmU-related protein [Staphylococcus]|uniref:Acetyltransferase n=1 Tax=Staphylococcus xylosus TaxID=1288 RepID=A0A418IPR4_STAXY|nr:MULTISPECIES: DapH/DapD/GlmU-related protein [Staphylococcus]MBF0812857.1 acetyltransferase [Staphylococcus saprophyticus]MDW8544085.1 DapH/DapD/GlmU-related protein [Staphylococcus sp. KG4-1]MRF37461.1 acetyltransferase [Staphylococcus sp. KY49P]MDW8561165.1 DapH/DapD/GlmU-related protein [Staphylococcus sp. KG4-3]NQD98775.1 acetyltransferase [Staphylococcus xylosus]
MRNLKRQKSHDKNPLWRMYHYVRIVKIFKQTVIIEICRYLPIVKLKHWIYRKFLKMNIGAETAFAFKVVPDLLYPEFITIGKNCVIGYNTTILTHEFLVDEFKTGPVHIGDNTLIGANVTILPGVTIGNNVKVGAGAIVSKDIPDNTMAYGNPIQIKS